jgi:hypothetical protein
MPNSAVSLESILFPSIPVISWGKFSGSGHIGSRSSGPKWTSDGADEMSSSAAGVRNQMHQMLGSTFDIVPRESRFQQKRGRLRSF